jgi:hypothetical protein
MDVELRVQYDAAGLNILLGESSQFVLAYGASTITLTDAPPGTQNFDGSYVGMILEVRLVKSLSAKREALLTKLDPGVPRLSDLPNPIRVLLEEASNEITGLANQAAGLIRWHAGCRSELHPLTLLEPIEWSLDGETWHPFVSGIALSTKFYRSPSLTDEVERGIREDVAAGRKEPLAYELFYEAIELQERNPRSALLVLVSAAEIAVKSCIADLAPQAAWLTFNVPSPNVQTLMLDYLPKLSDAAHRAFQSPRDPMVDGWLSDLKAAVTARNELVHKGERAPEQHSLERMGRAVSALLRLMDYFAGRQWVRTQMHPKWVEALRLEEERAPKANKAPMVE